MLEQKLVALQRLVSSTQEATDSSWQALIDEDRLLSRLEVVENQLRAYSKANTEESIRKELIALQEDKSNYEKTVKDSLKKALEEKLEACRKVADTERMLSNSEDECAHVREELENLKQEQEMLLEKYSQLEKDSQELLQKMNETDRLHDEELERLKEEQGEVQQRLIALQITESTLGARAEELQAENDFIKDQLISTKERLEEAQDALKLVGSPQTEGDVSSQDQDEKKDEKEAPTEENNEEEPAKHKAGPGPPVEGDEIPVHHISLLTNGDDRTPTRESGVQVETMWREATKKEMNGRVKDATDGAMLDSVKTLKNTAEESVLRQVSRKKFELEEAEQRIAGSNRTIAGLKNELSQAHQDLEKHSQEINSLEQRLQDAEEHTRTAVEKAVAELRERLSPEVGTDSQDNDSETSSIQTLIDEPMIMVKEQERQLAAAPDGGISMTKESSSTSLNSSSDSDGRLQNHVQDDSANSSGLNETLLEIDTLKDELHTLRQKYSQLATENESISKQLQTTQQAAKLATDNATTLKGKLEEAEKSSRAVTAQLPSLQEQLNMESGLVQQCRQEIESLKKNLAEANQSSSSSKTELSQCKDKIITLSGDLEREKEARQKLDKQVTQIATLEAELDKERKEKTVLEAKVKQLQKRIAELEELEKQRIIENDKDTATSPSESGDLKSAVSSLEADLESSRQEKNGLKEEVSKLQKLLSESESARRKLADAKSDGSIETVDFKAEKESLQKQLTKANEDIERLRSSPSPRPQDVDLLRQRLEAVTQELNRTKDNNAMVQMKWLPVCVISIAILAAVFQAFLAMRVEV
ncbi:sarcolemmal membrane-associated protein-like isoform X1 [Lytechinus pictus]|uniref:sarcolemmal membrane-associated protein-like isoform X1 n=1 Tax=Lytechinus pictus TaxID=7653 RepID=UPI0030B9E61E